MATYQKLSKVEAYQLLADIKNTHDVSITKPVLELSQADEDAPDSVIKFINRYTITESDKFFENLRKLHNQKNHQLYPNIMNDELPEIETLKCLSSYMTSACIQMESMDDPEKCIELRQSVGLEIVSEALYNYYNGTDYDMIYEAKRYIKNLIKRGE